MDMKKIHTKEEMESALCGDKMKMDFALRQVVELMNMFGIAGIEQEMGGYSIKIINIADKDL